MPDFTIEVHWQCAESNTASFGGYSQTGLFNERQYPQCTCNAYRYGKRTENFGGYLFPKPCKHIIEAQKHMCGWHSAYSPEKMTRKGVCPKCGRSAEPVRVAV